VFTLFVVPVDFDVTPAMYTWVVHKAVERLTPNIALISTDDYWNNATEIISASRTIPLNTPHEYLVSRMLTVGDFDSLIKLGIDKNFFSAKYSNVSRSKSLSTFHQEFDEDLYSIACNHLEALSDVDALLMWSNCSTIQLACKKHSIQTIFNELGPLRPPNYHPAAYFDFSGLHDKSSAEDRFVRFRSCCESGNITILDRRDLIRILRANKPDCAALGQKLTGVALLASGQFFLTTQINFRTIA
jgi:hypothetical protein